MKNSSEVYKKLCSVYGDKAFSKWQCQNWFNKFIGGYFVVTDKKRTGHPVEVYDIKIKELIDTDLHCTTLGIV